MTTDAAVPEFARVRPRFHFTPRAGWINDPHGIVFAAGRYHLFFQYNPRAPRWAPECHWGHATSADLVDWVAEDVALVPCAGEIGCWSGSLVIDDGTPTILYTSVGGGREYNHGQIALARGTPAFTQWLRAAAGVIQDLPPRLDVAAFRDPFVWSCNGEWRMLVGAGLADGTAAAVQYSSRDLLTWSYDGVVVARHTSASDPLWTGSLWECPQLFELDGTWVLLVSVWGDDALHYVGYALGSYDGTSFTPRTWGRFSHGDLLYATSVFVDAEGRRCAMSWVRERATFTPDGAPWAGALSLPHVLQVVGDRLLVRPHPNLEDHLVPEPSYTDPAPQPAPVRAGVLRSPAKVSIEYEQPRDTRMTLSFLRARAVQATIALDTHGHTLTVRERGNVVLVMPTDYSTSARLEVVVDADIVELTTSSASGVGAVRVPELDGCDLVLEADHLVVVRDVTVFQGRTASVANTDGTRPHADGAGG